jgi:uncharacterized protein (TIGR00251 family)
MPFVCDVEGAARMTIRVQPRASRSEIVGVHGDMLKIRLAAPPVDGAANEELIRVLSSTFSLKRANLSMLSGASARTKVMLLRGRTAAQIRRTLGLDG